MGATLFGHGFSGIYIDDSDPEFFSNVKMSLNILRSKPVGKQVIEEISKRCELTGNKVVIEFSTIATAVPAPAIDDTTRAKLSSPGEGKLHMGDAPNKIVGNGGSCAVVRWNPSHTIPFTNVQRPSYISLGHELVHAHHFVHGTCKRPVTDVVMLEKGVDSGLAEEEARTVGLGPYADEALCENTIRHEWGQPKRTEYNAGNTLNHVTRTP